MKKENSIVYVRAEIKEPLFIFPIFEKRETINKKFLNEMDDDDNKKKKHTFQTRNKLP